MGKTLEEAPLTTATARAKLADGIHWRRLDADSHIGFRRSARGGRWLVRWRVGKGYRQAPLGAANDDNDRPTPGRLTFTEADRAAQEVLKRERSKGDMAAKVPTVAEAVADYVKARDKRESQRKGKDVRSDASRRLGRYILGQPGRGKSASVPAAKIAALTLDKLTEKHLQSWVANLPTSLGVSSVDRLLNDAKAALNAAHKDHWRALPANFPSVIKHGLSQSQSTDQSQARDNQILSDAEIKALLAAAKAIDLEQEWGGDLHRLVVTLAATGARFSQISRLRVDELQGDAKRLLVPSSLKGKNRKATVSPFPIGADVAAALAPAASGRPGDEPLLERWRRRQEAGSIVWVKDSRGPWQNSSELTRPWILIAERAGLPGTIPYALRHSSIVRGIRANLPLRLVAAMHDTSTAMIERHYSKWITSGLEDMARAAVVPLVEGEIAGGK